MAILGQHVVSTTSARWRAARSALAWGMVRARGSAVLALVANLRENAVLRYKDTAGAEGEASADLGEDEEAPRPFFRKR